MSKRHRSDDGRIAFITGASRGLGRATAERLALHGWRVFAAARHHPPGESSEDTRTVELIPVVADVRDERTMRDAVADILNQTNGRLDAVVANAGIAAVGTFEDTPQEVMKELMSTNYFGVLNTVRATLPALRAHQGRLVVMSSDAAAYGTPGLSGYTASKFALEGWAESLAYELRPTGVHLSIIRPGAFQTDIWRSPIYSSEDDARHDVAETLAANWREAGTRAADPVHVAATVERALTASHPKLHYTIGNDARRIATLRRLLPERLFIRFVEHTSNVPRRAPMTDERTVRESRDDG
jgi:NAD(P)-dependent dehydrogenase (short-subunit alcohol dehydrogenase family)